MNLKVEKKAVSAAKPRAVKMAIRDATKYYHTRSGAVHALDSVSLDVRESEFLCILGPIRMWERPLCCGQWLGCIRFPVVRSGLVTK